MKKPLAPDQVSRKKFLRRWIPFGVAMLRQAEGLGINVDRVRLESLADEIILAEEWAKGAREWMAGKKMEAR